MDQQGTTSITTREIIHAGMQEISRSRQLLQGLSDDGVTDGQLRGMLEQLAQVADPDAALSRFVDIRSQYTQYGHPLRDYLTDGDRTGRLLATLGASNAMGMLMRTRPSLIEAATGDPGQALQPTRQERIRAMLDAIGVTEDEGRPVATRDLATGTNALRRTYRNQLAAIMAADVTAVDPIAVQPAISRALSDIADAALEGALAIARREVPESGKVRFAVIGMGKLGAQELNYVSDVDLIYVVEPTMDTVGGQSEPSIGDERLTRIGTKMATVLQKVCQSVIAGTTEPALWSIDTALRPEGKDGPLVRRLEAHRAYYGQWSENWEFQALLKARAVAGDAALGDSYMQMASSFVWQAAKRENFVNDCQNMRERVERLIAPALRDREIKLGRGGLRDVEFTVQMLQLVHGRTDASLRVRSTLDALQALSEGGYVSRRQAKELSWDYRFERVLEHRQQMWQLKRTHLFPDLGPGSDGGLEKKRNVSVDELNRNEELRRLARAVSMRPEELVERYDETRRQVRHLHNDIYYRPMLPISATQPDESVILSPEATMARYEAIGFADPEAALRHVRALTDGVTRAAKINRILLPAVLRWLGEGQNPDMGLLYWRTLEEHFGQEHEYLGFLRDSPNAARRLCHVLSNSRFLGDSLNKSLESITWLGHDDLLTPRTREALDTQCAAVTGRYSEGMRECATALRAIRRHEIERIGLGWMSGVDDDRCMLTGMTDVYDAILDAALRWSIDAQLTESGIEQAPAAITIIAMGRYGGREVNFSSDADIIIVYRPAAGADEATANQFARKVQEKLRSLMQGPVTLEPKIELDMDLRPEGKNGPMVRSYASCEEYYRSWSSTWERQALLRARHAAGDAQLAWDFLDNIADPMRYPDRPLTPEELGQIRRLKARMEAERLPRGVRRDRHLKLGKGGLSDVEWTVQLLQLQYAHDIPELRVNSTMAALDALASHGLIDGEDAAILREAWQMCTDARNGNYLWSGRANQADILPTDVYSLGGIAVYLGYDANRGQRFENDILAVMRRARDVTERLFYGNEQERP
ncbi:bifunctional [glutamine synthetase] adenylyltransferase/[glutamine synthetase]-adenylyl-L-tyrosine phosphorylase [Bifidobacterium cuniculi]|uniref:Glutamate-ammonia-ligase adenylyltransferase n=1 Tax=Bifidobacterium cuniculi TaxID=1688 RepID=A0A087B4N0_9BIFI|nr:bifunctional [glutamine synthetase] adenylyltransferase/[glutamine synthetase]-adenylyl-L-tyrosine phosphorylase [Bifidobacterium cuniculi]KFI65980.1 glutamate-ammonia-ligase adenylyltransferase [Bifidobacterium cuniculi]